VGNPYRALYLHRVLGYDALQIGLAFLPFTLIMGVLSVCYSARLIARFGARNTLVPGLALIAAGLGMFSRAPDRPGRRAPPQRLPPEDGRDRGRVRRVAGMSEPAWLACRAGACRSGVVYTGPLGTNDLRFRKHAEAVGA
jgi:hypothetical protein